MTTASKQTVHAIEEIVNPLPIGTNLSILHILWSMMSGAFLPASGAFHTALALSGFDEGEVRRGWSALRHGVWGIDELVGRFGEIVMRESEWEAHEYGGYRPLAADLTAIWRPRLGDWKQKMYRQLTRKGFKGVGFGLLASVGSLNGRRMPLLRQIVRGNPTETNEEGLKGRTLAAVARQLRDKEVLVHDGGVTLSQVQAARVELYVVRLPTNITGRHNSPRPYKGVGAYPTKGKLVRPLERTYNGVTHPATPCDIEKTFRYQGRKVKARGWLNLVRSELNASPDNDLYHIWVFDDPDYEGELVLGTNLPPHTNPLVIYQLFVDRWPIEQIPLVSKTLLGCQRQFFHHPTSCFRAGELAFLAGNLLTWLALTLPPMPTGFWDRNPARTPGRLRRRLARAILKIEWIRSKRIRRKASRTDHLPKGIEAHRRRKRPLTTS